MASNQRTKAPSKTAAGNERPIPLKAFVSKFANGHGFNVLFRQYDYKLLRQYKVAAVKVRPHETALIKFETRKVDSVDTYKLQDKRKGSYGVIRVGNRTFLQVAGDWLRDEETGSVETRAEFYPISGDLLIYEPTEQKPVDR